MKKYVKILAVAVLAVMLFCSFAFADETAPKYTGQATFDSEELLLQGTVTHVEGTPEAERIYARITYFMGDGSFTVVPAVITKDGSFESMISGNVVHISVTVIDRAKIVPGTYEKYSGNITAVMDGN